MPIVEDLSTRIARRILRDAAPVVSGDRLSRSAAIVALELKPVIALLREAKESDHRHSDLDACCPRCHCAYDGEVPEHLICNCGTDKWNARIDKVLNGLA